MVLCTTNPNAAYGAELPPTSRTALGDPLPPETLQNEAKRSFRINNAALKKIENEPK